MDDEQQALAQEIVDDISDEEVEAFIALIEERLIEKLVRAIENVIEQRSDMHR
jgi:hypothetical protein